MAQSLAWVAGFVILLALIPFGLKWLQRRTQVGLSGNAPVSRVVSAIAVGPHQRVVTVEVGPEGNRTWLVLGVTAQSINCLHSIPVGQTPVSELNSGAISVQGGA
jgi:flagellar protein FliO/FliZ